MIKNITLLVILFLSGCSMPPSDDVLTEIIQFSMKEEIPVFIIGNAFGGKLETLEVIEIENVEKKKWEPNVIGKTFGKKAYDYWAVTARVRGTGRVSEPFGVKGELRGFHARHIWTVRKTENGKWSVTGNDFTQEVLEQPVNPSSWVVAEGNAGKRRDSSMSATTKKNDDHENNRGRAQTKVNAVAIINGEIITLLELDVYAEQRVASKGADDGQSAILEELIDLELMLQEGVKKGLNSNERVVATLDQQQRTVVASAAINDFMSKSPVSDKKVRKMYDEQIGTGTAEYNARHILVKNREDAVQIISQLNTGEDFSELAKKKSTGPSKASGGKLGWFGAGQMVKPFSDAVALLEKGTYTKKPVQTQFGWHVIILDDVRRSTPPDFDVVKERLVLQLSNQNLAQHISDLRKSAEIKIISQ